jgi:hypothetical protein
MNMEVSNITEKLEELASAAERESMCESTIRLRAAQLRGYIEGLRDAMKVLSHESTDS